MGYGPYRSFGAYRPYHYPAYNNYYGHYYGKREAGAEPEAAPEADPQIILNRIQPTFPISQQTYVQQAYPTIQTVYHQLVPQLETEANPAKVVQIKSGPVTNFQTP